MAIVFQFQKGNVAKQYHVSFFHFLVLFLPCFLCKISRFQRTNFNTGPLLNAIIYTYTLIIYKYSIRHTAHISDILTTTHYLLLLYYDYCSLLTTTPYLLLLPTYYYLLLLLLLTIYYYSLLTTIYYY